LDANRTNLEADVHTPTTFSSSTSDSRNNGSLEDDDIEKRLYLALVVRRDELPAWYRDPSPHCSSKPLQGQICQDDNNHTGRDRSGLNASKVDNEGRKQRQHQEVEEEQKEHDNNSGSNSEIDDGNGDTDCSSGSSD
jgi:hypothetical protein